MPVALQDLAPRTLHRLSLVPRTSPLLAQVRREVHRASSLLRQLSRSVHASAGKEPLLPHVNLRARVVLPALAAARLDRRRRRLHALINHRLRDADAAATALGAKASVRRRVRLGDPAARNKPFIMLDSLKKHLAIFGLRVAARTRCLVSCCTSLAMTGSLFASPLPASPSRPQTYLPHRLESSCLSLSPRAYSFRPPSPRRAFEGFDALPDASTRRTRRGRRRRPSWQREPRRST